MELLVGALCYVLMLRYCRLVLDELLNFITHDEIEEELLVDTTILIRYTAVLHIQIGVTSPS